MKIKFFLMGVVLCLATGNSQATNFTFQAGLTIGGDAFIDTGNDNDLTAGDAIYFGGAVDFDVSNDAIVRLGVALRDGEAEFTDATEEFSTTQFELLYLKSNDTLVYGGGVSLHQSPEYKINFDGFGTLKQNFDEALGFVGQLGYLFDNHELGARLEIVDFETTGPLLVDDSTIDGTSISFYYAYRFR
ncbi:MAG TPA: hypothetical protein VF268_05690 [Gammaproteobacteria bacterium]